MTYKIKLALGLLLLAQFASCFISNDFMHNPLDNALDFSGSTPLIEFNKKILFKLVSYEYEPLKRTVAKCGNYFLNFKI